MTINDLTQLNFTKATLINSTQLNQFTFNIKLANGQFAVGDGSTPAEAIINSMKDAELINSVHTG